MSRIKSPCTFVHLHTSSVEVEERVELYPYSPFASSGSGHIIGRPKLRNLYIIYENFLGTEVTNMATVRNLETEPTSITSTKPCTWVLR